MAAWLKQLLAGDPVTDLKGTAYRMFYTDSAGDVQELTHGTNGYFLQSQGPSANPVWAEAASGSHALDAGQTDVVITTPANHELLAYNTGNWINETAAEAGLATTTHESSHEVGGSDALVDGATSPSATAATAASGTATKPPRMDHVHAIGSGSVDDSTIQVSAGVLSIKNDGVAAAQISDTATDITFSQLILTPKSSGSGTTEGTMFYDSDDNHVYVYVV